MEIKIKHILSNRFTFGEAVFCILKQNHIFILPMKTPLCKSAQLYTSSEQAAYLSFPCLQTSFARKLNHSAVLPLPQKVF